MKNLHLFQKFSIPILLAVVTLFILMMPVNAVGTGPYDKIAPVRAGDDNPLGGLAGPNLTIPGSDILISSETGSAAGSGSPEIKVSGDGIFIAVVYFKIAQSQGNVYLKSATAAEGWLTSKFLGRGTKPRLVFSNNNTVNVVWASADNRTIKFARCTLAAATLPTCTFSDVATTGGSVSLDDPDVAADVSGNLHVVWEDNGSIKSARSTNNGQNWTQFSSIAPPSGRTYRTPLLAYSNSVLHLVFVRKRTDNNFGKAIEYRRDPNDAIVHNWTAAKSIGNDSLSPINIAVTSGYDDFDNVTLAASGNNVHMAWEAHSGSFSGSNDDFGLMRISSSDNGQNWAAPVSHITSNSSAQSSPEANKLSKSQQNGSVVPVQEEGLRPSLTISSTTFALVWQQRRNEGCGEGDNKSSEIYFAYNSPSWLTDTLADNSDQYSIDPDLAVGPGGIRHFVFMKDSQTTGCDGGEALEYGVYYRGPYTVITNDGGEEEPTPEGPPNLYLPVIRRQ